MSPKLNRRGFVTAMLADPVASVFPWPTPMPAVAAIPPEIRREVVGTMASITGTFCEYLAHDWSVGDCAAYVQDEHTPEAIAVVKSWLRELEQAL